MTERYRTRGAWSPRSGKSPFWWNTNQSPKPTPVFSNVPGCYGEVESMHDTVTPNFHRRSQEGQTFSNRMYKITEKRNFDSIGPVFRTTAGGVTYYGELIGGPWGMNPDWAHLSANPPPSLEWLYEQVRTRALSSVKKPDYAGLVALGELRETLSYLRNPLKTGLKLAKTLDGRVRGSLKSISGRRSRSVPPVEGTKAYENFQDLYMEFRYGVRPLIKDISDLAEAISNGDRNRKERETFRSMSKDSYASKFTLQGEFSGITYDANFSYKRDTTVRAGLLYQYDWGVSGGGYGLSLDQVPATIWELVPLSFVWDWFLNVGQFIQALTPVAGMNRLAEWTVVKTEEELLVEKRNYRFGTWPNSTIQDGTGSDLLRRTILHRMPTVGIGSLVFDRNSLPNLVGDKARLLDLITLTQQMLRLPMIHEPKGHQNIGAVKQWRGTDD